MPPRAIARQGDASGSRAHPRHAPWYTQEHADAAQLLPPVSAPGDASHEWSTNRTRTWASKTSKPLLGGWSFEDTNRFRPLFDLPEASPAPEIIKRAVSMRCRFIDVSGDPGGGARARRAFNNTGGAVRFLWNSALKYIKKLPAPERGRAFNADFLSKMFCSETTSESKGQGDGETEEAFATRKRKRVEKDRDYAARGVVAGAFINAHPWLGRINAQVRQQALRDLSKAHTAGKAKQKHQRDRGENVAQFTIKPKHRGKSSTWTFCIPAQAVVAEHVLRPTEREPPPGTKRRTWTKLTLPANLGGNGVTRGRGTVRGVVFLSGRAPLGSDGRLLGDLRFTRDPLGNWDAIVQRPEIRPREPAPFEKRKTVHLDPGSRAG